jgi:hypothetical protein
MTSARFVAKDLYILLFSSIYEYDQQNSELIECAVALVSLQVNYTRNLLILLSETSKCDCSHLLSRLSKLAKTN